MITAARPFLQLELRPVEAPAHATAGACVYVLLPTLEELFGREGFGRRDPIWLPGVSRPVDGWTLFGAVRRGAWTIH